MSNLGSFKSCGHNLLHPATKSLNKRVILVDL